MSTALPTVFERPSSADVLPGEPVLADDWATIVEGQHYLWNQQIAHFGGTWFSPAWETTLTSFTTDNQNDAGRDLDEVTMWGRFSRVDLGGSFLFQFVVVGQDVEIEFTMYEGSSSNTLNTLTTSTTNTAQTRFSKGSDIFTSNVSNDGPVRVEMQARALSTQAKIYQVDLYENPTSAQSIA
jgi:hypothetical protein